MNHPPGVVPVWLYRGDPIVCCPLCDRKVKITDVVRTSVVRCCECKRYFRNPIGEKRVHIIVDDGFDWEILD